LEWTELYEKDHQGWLDGTKHAEQTIHIGEIMQLAGDLRGKHVVDLGGGALLCRAVPATGGRLTVVEYALTACRVVEELGCEPIYQDIVEFLRFDTTKFDVALMFGVIDYLPPGSLDLLFERCPSPVLATGIPCGESYLQYKSRTCAYSRLDVLAAASKHGWTVEDIEAERTSHTWGRFRRNL